MGGDADFEHARLLKIHTSVVVSARSITGNVRILGPLKHFLLNVPGIQGASFMSPLILLSHEIPQRLHYTILYLYSRWMT